MAKQLSTTLKVYCHTLQICNKNKRPSNFHLWVCQKKTLVSSNIKVVKFNHNCWFSSVISAYKYRVWIRCPDKLAEELLTMKSLWKTLTQTLHGSVEKLSILFCVEIDKRFHAAFVWLRRQKNRNIIFIFIIFLIDLFQWHTVSLWLTVIGPACKIWYD